MQYHRITQGHAHCFCQSILSHCCLKYMRNILCGDSAHCVIICIDHNISGLMIEDGIIPFVHGNQKTTLHIERHIYYNSNLHTLQVTLPVQNIPEPCRQPILHARTAADGPLPYHRSHALCLHSQWRNTPPAMIAKQPRIDSKQTVHATSLNTEITVFQVSIAGNCSTAATNTCKRVSYIMCMYSDRIHSAPCNYCMYMYIQCTCICLLLPTFIGYYWLRDEWG